MRVDRWWVGRLGRLAARLGHRRVEGHARGGGLLDGVVTGVVTIDEQLGGAQRRCGPRSVRAWGWLGPGGWVADPVRVAGRLRLRAPLASSRSSKQTTKRSGRKTYQTLRITLGVHPWCGREIVVLGSFGDQVRAELPDGRACYVPLSWTDWRPRPEPLGREGRPVRLAPEALRSLATWVRGRVEASKLDSAEHQKLDIAELEDQKRHHGVRDQARGRAASAAVVGKVGASSSGRARQRTQRRGRR
jgi:hypothetical protein